MNQRCHLREVDAACVRVFPTFAGGLKVAAQAWRLARQQMEGHEQH
jgi:hypothetical protein